MNDYLTATVTVPERNEAAPFADRVIELGNAIEKALFCMERYSRALGGVGLPPREKREIGDGLSGVIEESRHRVEELTRLIEECRQLIGG